MSLKNVLNRYSQQLKHLKPYQVFKKLRIKAKIQATQEAGRDILNTAINQTTNTGENNIASNNYRTYVAQVQAAYELYKSFGSYGGELFGGLLNLRTAFLGGEGVSVKASTPELSEFIDNLIKVNSLNGQTHIAITRMAEMEGQALLRIKHIKNETPWIADGKEYINIEPVLWINSQYEAVKDPKNPLKLKSIAIIDKLTNSKKEMAPSKNLAWVALGGTAEDKTNYTHKFHRILTQIVNVSRAAYDLRNSTHLYGHPTAAFKFDSNDEGAEKGASTILNAIDSGNWAPGQAYAGKAQLSLVTPQGEATNLFNADIVTGMRFIAMTLDLPIHFLSWPDLMSNRATAENLLEVISAGTKEERLVLEQLYTETIWKALHIAVEYGMVNASILTGTFEVKIPMVSIAMLKHIIDIWVPLAEKLMVTESTVRNLIPGINPKTEEEELDRLKEERQAKALEIAGQNKEDMEDDDDTDENAEQ